MRKKPESESLVSGQIWDKIEVKRGRLRASTMGILGTYRRIVDIFGRRKGQIMTTQIRVKIERVQIGKECRQLWEMKKNYCLSPRRASCILFATKWCGYLTPERRSTYPLTGNGSHLQNTFLVHRNMLQPQEKNNNPLSSLIFVIYLNVSMYVLDRVHPWLCWKL